MSKSILPASFKRNNNQDLSFLVVDDSAKYEAERILSKIKIPDTPALHALERAYYAGNSLVRKLRTNEIQIVKNKDLSKEEAYQHNVNIYQRLIEQRDAIISVVEDMVKPVIKNLAGVNHQIDEKTRNIEELQKRVEELEKLFDKIYGKKPELPYKVRKKNIWKDTLKRASNEIINTYNTDMKSEIRNYRSLRDASDEFFELYFFVNKPDLTKDMLYENVKKANSPWLGKSGEDRGMPLG